MKPGIVFGAIVVALLLLTALRAVLGGTRPRSQQFKCARCGTLTTHSERTIEAWRNKRTKFFCQKCHAHWLASRPTEGSDSLSPSRSSGCLGVAALLVLVPIVAAYIWAYA